MRLSLRLGSGSERGSARRAPHPDETAATISCGSWLRRGAGGPDGPSIWPGGHVPPMGRPGYAGGRRERPAVHPGVVPAHRVAAAQSTARPPRRRCRASLCHVWCGWNGWRGARRRRLGHLGRSLSVHGFSCGGAGGAACSAAFCGGCVWWSCGPCPLRVRLESHGVRRSSPADVWNSEPRFSLRVISMSRSWWGWRFWHHTSTRFHAVGESDPAPSHTRTA